VRVVKSVTPSNFRANSCPFRMVNDLTGIMGKNKITREKEIKMFNAIQTS
jgi:hypothetical protein